MFFVNAVDDAAYKQFRANEILLEDLKRETIMYKHRIGGNFEICWLENRFNDLILQFKHS